MASIDEREDFLTGQLLPALQEGEVYEKGRSHDLPTEATDQIGGGGDCAAGGQDVVKNEDALAGDDGILVHLNGVCTVFQSILGAYLLPRQLARFAGRDKGRAQLVG